MGRDRWYKDMVFYQIWPRSFKDGDGDGMGDLQGVYEKLNYIKSLGVDGIWFSPLYPSPGADCGYDISDYRDIAAEFGVSRSLYYNWLKQTATTNSKEEK